MTRIVCPDCAAAYEVPPSAIPPGGRDVQCAACGHNWYQLWQAGTDAAAGADTGARQAIPSGEPAPWASRFDGLSGDRLGIGASSDPEVPPASAAKRVPKPVVKSARVVVKDPKTPGAMAGPKPHKGAEPVPGGSARMRAALEQSAAFLAQIEEDVPAAQGFGESPQPRLTSITDPVAALHPRAARFARGLESAPMSEPETVDPAAPEPTPAEPTPVEQTATDPAETPPVTPTQVDPPTAPAEKYVKTSAPVRPSVRQMAANLPIFGDEEPEFELPMLPPRPIDPAVLAVLRSEAAVETRARLKENSQPLESQDELPLVPQPRRSASEVRARLARLQEAERKGETDTRWTKSADSPADPPEPDPVAPQAKAVAYGFPPLPPMAQSGHAKSRRDVADEMKRDALKIDGSGAAGPAPSGTAERRVRIAGLPAKVSSRELAAYEAQQQQRGFRIGFGIPVAAVCLGLALYLSAPLMMDRLPEAEPVLQVLVERGDQMQERLASGIIAAFDRLGPDGGS